jgi:hypothetical protein
MKPTRIVILPVLALTLLLAILLTAASQPSRAAASNTKSVTVDYAIALLDAGVDQADIVARIMEKNLTFRVAPGDIDRLRAAGAGKALINTVTREGVGLENSETAPSGITSPTQEQGGADTNGWGRPSRLGGKEGADSTSEDSRPGAGTATAAPSDSYDEGDTNGEGIEELPDGGYYAYPGYDYYYPGYYGYFSYGYAYPYYYYPNYYYPYRSYGYYSSPYFRYPRHSFRTMPRGGGSFRGAPHGGGVRPAPRGGGHQSAPRGSHHH